MTNENLLSVTMTAWNVFIRSQSKQKSLVKNQFCSAEIVSSIPNGRRLKSREWCNHYKGRNNFFPEGRIVSFN